MAAARSRELVLVKMRLMWDLTVWLLRQSCWAISGLVRPCGDEGQDLGFALGEAVGQGARAGGGGRGRGGGGGQQRVVHAGIEHGQPGHGGLQGPGDVGAVGVLGHVAAGSGPERLEHVGVVDVGGEDHDGHLRVLGDQAAGGADAVQHRHVQVEQDRVRAVLGHLGDGLLAVGGRPDHLDAGQAAQQQDQALAHAGLVVGDDQAERGRGREGHDATRRTGGLAGASAGASGWASGWGPAASGSPAATIQWPSSAWATRVPFSSRSRSLMPVSP